MDSLLKIKVSIKKFVGKNDAFIVPIVKFLLTFLALFRINSKLGFMGRISSLPITVIVALAGSFLPLNLTIVILGLIVVAHVYALSLEAAIVVLVLFLVMFLLYFRFAAKDSYAGILTPLAFVFKMPYVMPVSMGLVGDPTSMVAVGSGVITYQLLHYISVNADTITNTVAETKVGQFRAIIDALLGNRTMFALVVSYAVTVLVVYFIRRLPIKYCWSIAIGAGELVMLIVTMIASKVLGGDISFVELFLGILISAIVNLILQYFLFDLNYNRVEKVQFEDDEYYYYVKAVPKNEIVEYEPEKKQVKKKPVPRNRRPAPARPARPAQRPAAQRPDSREARPTAERPVRPDVLVQGRSTQTRTVAQPRPVAGQRPVTPSDPRTQAERTAAAMNRANNNN